MKNTIITINMAIVYIIHKLKDEPLMPPMTEGETIAVHIKHELLSFNHYNKTIPDVVVGFTIVLIDLLLVALQLMNTTTDSVQSPNLRLQSLSEEAPLGHLNTVMPLDFLMFLMLTSTFAT